MTEAVVLLDRPRPHVGRLRIHRPDKRNAMDAEVRQALIDGIDDFLKDGQTRALVIGGVQGVLSAGGDVSTMVGLSEAQARERMQHVHSVCRTLAAVRLPVVVAMEGIAAGAAVGLSLLCDRIVAGPGTKILFPFLKLGLTPDWGQLFTLPRRVGHATALRLLTSGQVLGGEEAHRMGLVDVLVQDDQVMDTSVQWADEMAQLPSEAFARMKQRLQQPSLTLEQELAREETDQAACLLSDDFKEGFDAFRNKRPAQFMPSNRKPNP
jgi:enoyl-CoA hydratase/carnithine racemase